MRKIALLGALALSMPFAVPLAASAADGGTGWYFRGDLGYSWNGTPDAYFNAPGFGNMTDKSIANSGISGVGIGFDWNSFFRTDLTLDYAWPSDFHGHLPNPGNLGGPYSNQYATISSWTTLVNAYVDVGHWNGFTPYIGGGIGAADVATSNVHFSFADGTGGKLPGSDQWNFAWALTVGTSFTLSRNWMLDVNYRYLNIGDAVSGSAGPHFNGRPMHYDNLDSSEIRVGVRALFN